MANRFTFGKVGNVIAISLCPAVCHKSIRKFLIGFLLVSCAGIAVFAQTQMSTSPDDKTFIVDDAPEMDVIAFGKKVIVKNRAKSVLAVGGDVLVEGRVEEDVVTFGGSVTQVEAAFVGGHIFVIGGAYRPESQTPLRGTGKETIMIAAFEDEIRDMAQNPAQIFAPNFSLIFLAWKMLSVLFWFVVSFAFATLAPGAVSRAVARLRLSALKVTAIGLSVLILTAVGVSVSVNVLPDYLSVLGVVFGFMMLFLFLLAYVFGRVALQVSFGKIIQKYLFSEGKRSESLAILFGVVAWTIILAIPYLWPFAMLALFGCGIGLVLTARSKVTWKRE